MTDYSKMSDFEINKLVAHNLGFVQQGRGWITGADGIYDYIAKPNDDYRIGLPDYCNSWADAGLIAEKNRIGTMPSREGKHMAWDTAGGMFGDKQAHSENLCRAICIVFLMMNEGE